MKTNNEFIMIEIDNHPLFKEPNPNEKYTVTGQYFDEPEEIEREFENLDDALVLYGCIKEQNGWAEISNSDGDILAD